MSALPPETMARGQCFQVQRTPNASNLCPCVEFRARSNDWVSSRLWTTSSVFMHSPTDHVYLQTWYTLPYRLVIEFRLLLSDYWVFRIRRSMFLYFWRYCEAMLIAS